MSNEVMNTEVSDQAIEAVAVVAEAAVDLYQALDAAYTWLDAFSFADPAVAAEVESLLGQMAAALEQADEIGGAP